MSTDDGGRGELRRRGLHSLAWSWAGTGLSITLQLLYAAIIARLVEPFDFGLLASALLALRFITYLARLGVTAAVIQRESLLPSDVDAAHLVSVIAGAVGAALMFLAAPLIGWLLDVPESVVATRWLSLGLLINGINAVPDALLRRRLAFRRLATIQVLSYTVSNLVVAVGLALLGFGLAALLASYLVGWCISLVLSIASLDRRPRLGSWRHAGHFVRFGGLVSVASVLDVVSSTLDTVLVGRLGSETLGQYNRASLLVSLPVEQASSAANRVAMSGLARLQGDREVFGRSLEMAIGLTAMFVAVPVAAGAALADPLTRVVLGPGWSLAAQLLPLLATAHALSTVTQVVVSGAEAAGEVAPRFRAQLLSVAVGVGAVTWAFLVPRSAVALAASWLISEFVRLMVHAVLAVRRLHASSLSLAKRLGASVATGATLWVVVGLSSAPFTGRPVIALLVGVLMVPVTVVVLWRVRILGTASADMRLLGITEEIRLLLARRRKVDDE